MQAEVLIAYYFFRTGRCLEAKYHASGAATIALACGLHTLRSSNQTSPSPISVAPNQISSLPQPRDTVEEGERINGFWTVFMLCKNLAVAVEAPENVCGIFEAPGVPIDTPWPLDMESYKEVSTRQSLLPVL